jgi:hypothetical protein
MPLFSPIITANWTAPSGERWTLPLGGGFGKTFQLGEQHMQVMTALYGNASPNQRALIILTMRTRSSEV